MDYKDLDVELIPSWEEIVAFLRVNGVSLGDARIQNVFSDCLPNSTLAEVVCISEKWKNALKSFSTDRVCKKEMEGTYVVSSVDKGDIYIGGVETEDVLGNKDNFLKISHSWMREEDYLIFPLICDYEMFQAERSNLLKEFPRQQTIEFVD